MKATGEGTRCGKLTQLLTPQVLLGTWLRGACECRFGKEGHESRGPSLSLNLKIIFPQQKARNLHSYYYNASSPASKSFQQFYLADATKSLLLTHGCTCLYETRTKRKRDPISRVVRLQSPVRSPMLPSPLLLLAFPTVVTLIGHVRRRFTGGA